MGKIGQALARWKYLKYVVLGVVTVFAAGSVGFALFRPITQEPVSERVASAMATPAVPTISTPPVLPNVVFLGDSYIAGSTMDAGIQFPDLIAGKRGWNQIMLGEGGSGYITKGNKGTTFGDRVQAAIDAKPAMVVVSGGFNDKDVAALPAAALDTVTRLRDALPGVPLVVFSNFVPNGEPNPVQVQKHDILADVASKTGATFIDVTGLFIGHTDMIAADQTHPTAVGHQFIADALMTRLPEPKKL